MRERKVPLLVLQLDKSCKQKGGNNVKKQVISGVVSLLTAGIFLLPGAADAYRGDPSLEGPNCTAERHEAMTAACQ